MKPYRILTAALGATIFLGSMPARAADTDLANIPLANATTATILPNIQFILDDSTSMDWNYLPDYVNDGSYCRGTGTSLVGCNEGDPPWYATAFNGVYYNPLVNYIPPKNADGTSKTSYTTWGDVPKDGYGIQSSSTIDLATEYPERMACKSSGDNVNGANCKSRIDAANAYSYPDGTYDTSVMRYSAPFYYNVSVEWCKLEATSGPKFGRSGNCQPKKDATYKYPRFYGWSRVDIKPATTSYAGPNGTTRTYAEEMTNFANWYAWYRTRMQTMKTSMSLAFADVRGTPNDADAADKSYFHARVGFTTISSTNATDGARFLAIANFDAGQKGTWYSRLFAIDPSPGGSIQYTPLRGALAKAGRIYAGKLGTDPVQYSCQRNFSILSTDGYWNDNDESSSYGPDKENGTTNVGDQDKTATKPSYDKNSSADTLADVAYYYYHTDLRADMPDNVTPAGTNADVDDAATHQHMTTFTIGLGVDGTLTFQDGYKTSLAGDYYNIAQGSTFWPVVTTASTDTKIDDLWHAAVNGRGTYFSARDPGSLVTGLSTALGAMKSASGSGAAAATSNLQPTAGDNYIYVANYRTVNWDGELSAYTIDLSSGVISSGTTWQAAALLDAKIAATGDGDTRTVYTSLTGASPLLPLTWASLGASAYAASFDNTKLSQYAGWSVADKAAATGQTMLDFLRGQHRNEDQDRAASFGSYYRLYRDREKTLGDIVHSQPVYVAKPLYSFSDSGYSSFAAAQAGRAKTVYVAANDGMLHAFDGTTGQERWAYVPAPMIKDMWRLADNDYATNHRFFVDGPIAVGDVDAGGWKTILVGALGKGGRGYYALDITDPSAPVALWKFTADDNPKLGYTYGMPLITKLADGTWVVVVASGYNNVPDGAGFATADGGGYVFVLDAATGAVIRTIGTGVGSIGTPAGLAYLNIKVADFQTDNTTLQAYGGDLLGNLWRFDLDAGTASRVAALGASRSISAAPELGEIDGKTVLYFGTGRYLGSTDLDDTQTQAIYAIRDDGSTSVGTGQLIAQSMGGSGSSRTVTTTAVDWASDYGWYLELPDVGERVHLPAQLYFGTLLIASVVPAANECQPGGYSWMYFLDYRTGGGVDDNVAAVMFTSPLVGFTVARLPGGTPKVYGITADGGFPKGAPPTLPISTAGGGGAGSGKRVMWRELLD